MITNLGRREVVVAGAGPVGLFLGCRLAQLGVSCLLLEKEPSAMAHSRSIGVHPPSLERLAAMALADSFLARGIRITTGWAWSGNRCLGRLSFQRGPPPYPFVLSLPQHATEDILESCIRDRSPGCLWRGVTVTGYAEQADGIRVEGRNESGPVTSTGSFLVACDGPRSVIREQSGLTVNRSTYPDTYAMGDFVDRTNWGADAHIFLDRAGLVESFPLPGNVRRWVLKTGPLDEQLDTADFRNRVRQRTGMEVTGPAQSGLNHFRVHRALASSFTRGRLALAGDAAHEMSPFGGQGMNVGWLDAWDLAESLASILRGGADPPRVWRQYQQKARGRARRAIRQAAWNMKLGRATRWSAPRNLLVWILLHSPLRRALARAFTLRGL